MAATKFNASVSVDGNGVLTLKLGKVFSEFQRGDDPNAILYVMFYETIAGKKFILPYLDIGSGGVRLEQKNETTFTCALPPDYLATLAGRQIAVEVEVETDGPGDYEAWTTVNTPASLAPAEPLPEITSITYDPVTRTISAMLSNGQIAEPDQLNLAFIAHYGSNQATVEDGSWEYTPEVIGEIIDASIAECNEKNRKYVGTSFCFRVSNCFRVSTDNGEYYDYNEYGPGRAIYIYPDGSWKDLGTATSAPVAPGKDTTPPEKVTGLAVPVVDGKYKATLSWDTGVDNSGKVANYEIQLDDGRILKSSKTSINVSNLSIGEHSYRVRAIDKEKNVGEWSEVQTFTVKDMTAPTSVKGKATVNGYTVMFALSGKDNSGSIARYVVTCGDKSVETTTSTAVLSDFGVGRQTAYVVAYDAEGNASKETKVSFTVKDATPPEKVTGLAVPVVDGKYKATLSWDTGVDNSGKVANYEIQLDDGKILKSSKTSINVSNLSVGEHSYRVRAVDKEKNVGEWSEVQTFTVRDMTAPGSVSVKAKVEGNSLLLSWKTPKDNVGVTGYILKHGANLEHTETLTANMLSFQIDGIAKGSYQYQIVAVDAAGNESKAKAGKATIKTELPMAALNLELPDFASLSGFDSDVQAVPELMDDPLAVCHTLKLDAELKLSAAEMLGQDDANKRSGTLFAAAS